MYIYICIYISPNNTMLNPYPKPSYHAYSQAPEKNPKMPLYLTPFPQALAQNVRLLNWPAANLQNSRTVVQEPCEGTRKLRNSTHSYQKS